ncbi:MAG: hypothetical protein KGD60_11840 [Candidatus Thorarchaeota archaeon]|nr:hypothetical protein [Candidatus Thorarchaeota archaeon]
MYDNGILSYSASPSSVIHVDRGYATDRHEFEQNAKPWSELFEHAGPSLKSSISPLPNGEIKTRSLDRIVNTIDIQDSKNNDSSTSVADQETTTFDMAAYRYIKDIILLIRQS